MHLLATDRLICTRCGPDFGLVLFSERLEERRVIEGFFGCPNCREKYPIQNGFGDFRLSPRREAIAADLPRSNDLERAVRIAALLGLRDGSGLLLLSGASAVDADEVATMISGIEIAALHPALRDQIESPGVSRMIAGPILPFRSGSLRGVVLEGESGLDLLEEGFRVLAMGARLVYLTPPAGLRDRLQAMGMEVILDDIAAVVGVSKGR